MTQLTRLSLISILVFAAASLLSAQAPTKKTGGTNAGSQSLIERGRYIVENVAMCEQCHTPRDEHGNPERSRWLMGGPMTMEPAYPAANWAKVEPRLAGAPPGSDAEFIRLLTTGISRTGLPPNPPMPPFRMTRQDAEAVLAYLKSLTR
jgi:mono/diheme cytochrome c family protein